MFLHHIIWAVMFQSSTRDHMFCQQQHHEGFYSQCWAPGTQCRSDVLRTRCQRPGTSPASGPRCTWGPWTCWSGSWRASREWPQDSGGRRWCGLNSGPAWRWPVQRPATPSPPGPGWCCSCCRWPTWCWGKWRGSCRPARPGRPSRSLCSWTPSWWWLCGRGLEQVLSKVSCTHKQQQQAGYIRPGLIMVSGRASRKTEREGHTELMRNPKDWSLASLPLFPHPPSSPLCPPAPLPLTPCAPLSGLWTFVS